MANVREALKWGNADVDRDVAQCAFVLSSRLKTVKEASSITEAHTSVSSGQGVGPSSAPEC